MKKLRVSVNGVDYEVEVEVLEDDEAAGMSGGIPTNLYSQSSAPASPPPAPAASAPAPAPAAAPAPSPAPASGGEGTTLTSPLPGVVKDVKIQAGASVKENDPLLVLEAMKMETVISAPTTGTIKEVKVAVNQSVQQGEVLVVFE